MQEQGVVTAVCETGIKLWLTLLREAGGQVVHHPAGGLRAVFHLAGALEEFDASHPGGLRRVVGVGSRVGGWGGKNAVLHHRHLGAAVAVHAAQRDVRKISVAILVADINTGHARRNLCDVGVAALAEKLRVLIGGGARQFKDRLTAAHYRQRFEGEQCVLRLKTGQARQTENGEGRGDTAFVGFHQQSMFHGASNNETHLQ